MTGILEQLYSGNLHPADFTPPSESGYNALDDRFSVRWQAFFKSIPRNQKVSSLNWKRI